jgi:hypothetical protein
VAKTLAATISLSRRDPHRNAMIEKVLSDAPPQEAGTTEDY